MTDPGPETDDRHPADVVSGMVGHVLDVAATWPHWDGAPIEVPVEGEPSRIYTPHKAIRRVADHLVDHLAEMEARLAGRSGNAWTLRELAFHLDGSAFYADSVGILGR